jgi:hypothetical protein
MVTKLYVAWRDPINRSWYPVGRLTVDPTGTYTFVYTKGAINHGLTFLNMPSKWAYRSNQLFPLFSNRIISPERPEYKRYLDWLDMNVTEKYDPIEMLALTEGIKATDNFEFFQCPSKTEDGKYKVNFLVHGLRHIPKTTVERLNRLQTGQMLYLMLDIQNPYDSNAIALRTSDPTMLAGYCPRYLSPDVRKLITLNGQKNIRVEVKKLNIDAPLNLRLFCQVIASWPEGFEPCSEEDFQPVIEHTGPDPITQNTKQGFLLTAHEVT